MAELSRDEKIVLLVSIPGIVQEATKITLNSLPQVAHVELASGALSAIEKLSQMRPYSLVIDATLPAEEAGSLVRWVKQHRADMRCIVLARSAAELELASMAGADAVFLRSSSSWQLAEALWPADQENEARA